MIFDFGFELSGTRAVARARQSPGDIPDVVNGVESAKTLLVLATGPLGISFAPRVPTGGTSTAIRTRSQVGSRAPNSHEFHSVR